MKLFHFISFLLLSNFLSGQTTLSGIVSNQKGEKLELASVFFIQTQYGAVTDAEGNFSIPDIPNGLYLLKVTYVGYQSITEEIELDGRDQFLELVMGGNLYGLDSVEISANRVDAEGGFTFENFSADDLEDINLGQDIPMLLSNATSVLSSSDAGAGIGYTDMRIRGVDGNRINVTINGVPWNDSESHGVFFVNLPDLSTDAESIQIQRGVGTSTNGAGAFGGTVSIKTHNTKIKPNAKVSSTIGSFGTRKINVNLGSGLINDKYTVEGRYSNIKSDGYIDRATSDLRSYSLSVAKLTTERSLRFEVFSGAERTYQSWYGAPESKVLGDDDELLNHYNRNIGTLYNTKEDSINLFSSDRRYNYYTYDNEVDDYGQDHYQFHWSEVMDEKMTLNTTLFYTKGQGFFEQFRYQDDAADYNLTNLVDFDSNNLDVVNLVRRRWLDNDFFGALLNLKYDMNEKTSFLIGGGASKYIGDHFGQAVSVENTPKFNHVEYYRGQGNKSDLNIYVKGDRQLTSLLSVFGDLQFRSIGYRVDGNDNDGQVFDISEDYNFFNPKFGFNFKLTNSSSLYGSYARANREPVRNDFTDNPADATPEPETLDNLELGYRLQQSNLALTANVYYMHYTNQLIPTGALNDVGAAIRQNVDKSLRAGIELAADYKINDQFMLGGNVAFSRNTINDFTEIVYDYTKDFEIFENRIGETTIALSPSVIANASITYLPIENLKMTWSAKHVGEQFLDNTSNDDRKIDGFFINNFNAIYDLSNIGVQNIRLNLAVNNVFNTLYSNKGYTYTYILGDSITENYLYPQAGRYFLLGASLEF